MGPVGIEVKVKKTDRKRTVERFSIKHELLGTPVFLVDNVRGEVTIHHFYIINSASVSCDKPSISIILNINTIQRSSCYTMEHLFASSG
jgi:hypothetical protein